MAERAHPEDPGFKGTIYETLLRERYAFCLPYIQDKDVLDVPCGAGWGTSLLSGCASLSGVDLDIEAIDYARTHFSGIRFVQGRMEQLPFQDNSFDVVICLEGLEHVYLSDALQFLAEAYRILKHDGLLLVTVPLLNDGCHSTNPYHCYEFTPKEIESLLGSHFLTSTLEVFPGGDGPVVGYVGRRRVTPAAESPSRQEEHRVHQRAYDWLQTTKTTTGFCFAKDNNQTLLATCFGILLLEGLSRLQDIPQEQRNSWGAYLQSCQQVDSGLFLDPLLKRFPVTSTEHDITYLSQQMTYFALQALDALGMKAVHPIRFMSQYEKLEAVEDWLAGLNWSNPWLESNRVMFVLAFLIYQAEVERNVSAPSTFHYILDWLDRHQNPETGLWGTQHNASTLNAVAAAYHFVPFYEYVQRPVQKIKQIIDAALLLQQANGLFAMTPGGGACEDLDAIDLLCTFTRQVSYRADHIKRALVRAYWAVWNCQNEDGGYPYAQRNVAGTYRYSSWAGMEAELGQSDTWATWFRLLALETIGATYPGDLPPLGSWTFRRWPALGYHRLGQTLTERERAVLPLWLRPVRNFESGDDSISPAISVIVPCYNMGRYLYEALESVLAQTFQTLEVFVVNDGSTDEFTRLLLEHCHHPQIRIIHQKNLGVAAARNAGIRQARGQYICCLDADDRLLPTFLERAYDILETRPDAGFVSAYYQCFDGSEDIIRYQSCGLPEMLVQNQAMVPALFRRDIWDKIGGYCESLKGLQDWDFWIGTLELGYQGLMIHDVLFEYRVRPDSMYATTSQPENYRRIFSQIVKRHQSIFGRYLGEVLAGVRFELASLLLLYREQRDWIAHLEGSESRLEQSVAELTSHLKRLSEGNAWLESQRLAWESNASSLSEQLESSLADNAALREQLESSLADNAALREQIGAAHAAYEAIKGSRTWRLLSPLHRGIDRILPPASKRREFIARMVTREPKDKKTIRNSKWPANKPLVSVVIPCHNYGYYVLEAVDSVLAQTFGNYEIIIVDSNSRPETIKTLKSISHSKIIVYYRKHDHLVGDNRNFGIGKARGKYICCLDADDIVEPTYLEKALFVAETYHYDLVYPSVQCFQDSDSLWMTADTTFEDCAEANAISTVAVFAKSAWSRVGGFRDWGVGKDHVPEDWEFWVRILGHGFRAKCLREPLMKYRVHGQGLTATNRMPMEEQKRAIREGNLELLSPKNLKKVEGARNLQYLVKDPYANFINTHANSSVLFALPFTIVGGAETILLQLVDNLTRNNHKVSILATIKPPPECGTTSPLFKMITPHVYELYNFLDTSWWEDYLDFLILSKNIKIIFIVGCEFLYHLIPKIKKQYSDITIIDQLFNEHGHIVNNRKYSDLIDYNIVANDLIHSILTDQYDEDEKKIQVIIHGVDTKTKFNPSTTLPSANGVPSDRFVVSFMGRMAEEKAPENFVHIAHLLSHHPELFFVMTGDGPRRVHVLKLIEELGLEPRIYAPGIVDDVRPYLRRTDLVVVPSIIDGLPIIIMESLSMGKPVIASHIGGIPSIVRDGINGYLCDPTDLKAFADRIERLWKDAPLRTKLGRNARTYAVEHLDQTHMNQQYLSVFDRFIKGRSHATKR